VWALKKLYGRESMGIVRSTFLVDGEGVIRKVWRGVRVNGHIAEVQAAAAQLA
jgi:peroxiredoxin Q/BCP